jgi:hypothetical protein
MSVVVCCSAFKTGMQCIDQYAELCLNARERKLMNENVAGARHTFAYLCDDPLFQSGKPPTDSTTGIFIGEQIDCRPPP